MKFTIVPVFITNLTTQTLPINKRHLEGYDYHLFSYHGIPERHICKTDITKSHCKMTALLQYALTGT
jgi:ferrochelatase